MDSRKLAALALAVAACVAAPSTAAAADALQLVGEPQIDRAGMLLPDKWTSITGAGAIWDTDAYRGDYAWSIPASIPPGGARASLSLRATDKSGGRFHPVMDVRGNLSIQNGDGRVEASADLNAGRATDEVAESFTLVPGSYCDTCPISLVVGIQDGPHITFNYKVAPKPQGRPCRAAPIATLAQVEHPFLCLVDEPAPGTAKKIASPALASKDKQASVDVSSSAGRALEGTTIVGEAEARRARAEKIGAVVATCYFIGRDAFDYNDDDIDDAVGDLVDLGRWADDSKPAGRLRNCIAVAQRLIDRTARSGSARAAAGGCRVQRIVIGRKGGKRERPSRSSVRYACAGSGGRARIAVKRSGGLRSAVGKQLDLGVVRARTAPASGATLSFRFR